MIDGFVDGKVNLSAQHRSRRGIKQGVETGSENADIVLTPRP